MYAWGVPLIITGTAATLDHMRKNDMTEVTFLQPRFCEKEYWFAGKLKYIVEAYRNRYCSAVRTCPSIPCQLARHRHWYTLPSNKNFPTHWIPNLVFFSHSEQIKQPACRDYVRVQSNDSVKFHNKFNCVLLCESRTHKLSIGRVYTLLTMFSLAASIRLATFIIIRLHGAEASDVSSQSFHGNIIVIRILKVSRIQWIFNGRT